MNIKLIRLIVFFIGFHMQAVYAEAEPLLVIANKDTSQQLSQHDIARIYLGKLSKLPDGSVVEPLDITPDHPNYEAFARMVLKKSRSQLRAYWAKQIFTGRGKPPKTAKTEEQLVQLVAGDKRYLAYVSEQNGKAGVRVLHKSSQ